MGVPLTEPEFDRMLASYDRSAFRMETQPTYELDYEQAEFDRFRAGTPVPPPEIDWWRPWLDRLTVMTRDEGKTMSRVRITAEPPTPYQQWELWAARWHAEAGEDIRYLPRAEAERLSLPLDHDSWLLDDRHLIVMHFTSSGAIKDKELITDKGEIALHARWRDLAMSHAVPAAEIAAT
jgi:hypothetical protein